MPVRERKEIQELLRAQRIEFCIWQALFGRSITQLPKTIFAERRSVSKSTNTWTASSPRWRARRLDTTDLPGISVRKLRQQLRGKRCEVFSSDVKVRIRKDAADFYYYPDVTVDCSGAGNAVLFAEEARVIFEVLSPDTERIDRAEKLRNYRCCLR